MIRWKKDAVFLSVVVVVVFILVWALNTRTNCGKQRVSQLVTINQDMDDWDEEDDDKKTKSWEERVTYF